MTQSSDEQTPEGGQGPAPEQAPDLEVAAKDQDQATAQPGAYAEQPTTWTSEGGAVTTQDAAGAQRGGLAAAGPQGGLEALKARLGAELGPHGLDLARRILGELHIERSGGVPASALAKEAAGQLESADASWWNERGKEQSDKEFADLNNRGSAL